MLLKEYKTNTKPDILRGCICLILFLKGEWYDIVYGYTLSYSSGTG